MKIETTGNTKEEAEFALSKKRAEIPATAKLGDVQCYGNFETGYKLVQEYTVAMSKPKAD